MKSDCVLYAFPKSQDEEIRFSIRTYQDRQYLDIRLWFKSSEDGNFYPSRKGLRLGLEHMPEMKKGVERALKSGAEIALHSSPNSVE